MEVISVFAITSAAVILAVSFAQCLFLYIRYPSKRMFIRPIAILTPVISASTFIANLPVAFSSSPRFHSRIFILFLALMAVLDVHISGVHAQWMSSSWRHIAMCCGELLFCASLGAITLMDPAKTKIPLYAIELVCLAILSALYLGIAYHQYKGAFNRKSASNICLPYLTYSLAALSLGVILTACICYKMQNKVSPYIPMILGDVHIICTVGDLLTGNLFKTETFTLRSSDRGLDHQCAGIPGHITPEIDRGLRRYYAHTSDSFLPHNETFTLQSSVRGLDHQCEGTPVHITPEIDEGLRRYYAHSRSSFPPHNETLRDEYISKNFGNDLHAWRVFRHLCLVPYELEETLAEFIDGPGPLYWAGQHDVQAIKTYLDMHEVDWNESQYRVQYILQEAGKFARLYK